MNATNPPSIPIGLRKITIENFRGISSLELSFLDAFGNASDIVVLAGPNGCGKTSVLEACLLVTGNKELLTRDGNLSAVRVGTNAFSIVAELQTAGDIRKCSYGVSVTGSGHSYQRVRCLYFTSWRTPQLVGSIPITVGKQQDHKEDIEVNRLRLAKQFFVNAKFHALMRVSKNGPANGPSPYDESIQLLNEIWRTFYPGATIEFTIEPESDDADAGFDVFMSSPNSGRIPVDALSSGQLELFTLFGSLLRLKSFEGLFVIDEPELHLDPQWHAVMLRALRRLLPKAQFIVATHSPQIYDSVLSFQSFFLVPDDDPRAKAWKTSVEAANQS